MKSVSLAELITRLRTPVQTGSVSLPGMEVQVHRCESLMESSQALKGLALDSRHVKPGFVFVAFQGEHCHGLDYADQAFQSGATVVLAESGSGTDSKWPLLEVADLRQALRHLATAEQRPVIGRARTVAVTGSVGKTTTCRLGSTLTASHWKTHSPRNSFNNFLGVPVTILEAPEETEVLWLEMGTNEPGEIGGLASIGQPEIAVVTAVGATHLEKLGSVEGVFREKFSLFEEQGIRRAIAPVRFQTEEMPLPCWWTGPGGDVEVKSIPEMAGRFHFLHRPLGLEFEFEAPLTGVGSLRCLESALAAAVALEIPCEKLREAAPLLSLPDLRQELHRIGDVELVFDCYNASPPSVHGAVEDLAATSAARKLAVLGTMEELGVDEVEYHREVGRVCVRSGLDHVWCYGRGAAWLHEGVQSAGGSSSLLSSGEVGVEELESELRPGDRILFKASRKESLEITARQLKERLQGQSRTSQKGGGIA